MTKYSDVESSVKNERHSMRAHAEYRESRWSQVLSKSKAAPWESGSVLLWEGVTLCAQETAVIEISNETRNRVMWTAPPNGRGSPAPRVTTIELKTSILNPVPPLLPHTAVAGAAA